MARFITTSFALVGVVAGFLAGIFVARALNWHDGDEAKTMAFAFGGAIAMAALCGWSASRIRAHIAPRWHAPLGLIGSVLALASLVWLFGSIIR